MAAQDLRKLLEQTNDMLAVLSSLDTLVKYNLSIKEYLELISDFLNDEEKLKIFDLITFNPWVKSQIIDLISDDNVLLQALNNDKIVSDFDNTQICNLLLKLGDDAKKQILYNQDFMSKHQLQDYELKKIVASFSEGARVEILLDKELIENRLCLKDYQTAELIKELSNDEAKKTVLEQYDLGLYLKNEVIKSFSIDGKLDYLLNNDNLNEFERLTILESFDIDSLCDFLRLHKEDFCYKNSIHPYEIICKLESKKQIEFLSKLDDIDLSLNEKREILATLKKDVKQSIDTSNYPESYKSALNIEASEYGNIYAIDYEKNLEDYRGLDNLLRINPEEYTEEQRSKFVKLCDICPNMQVVSCLSGILDFSSTPKEYVEAEEWISSVIDKLKPEYSKEQKIAIIDNEIGKKVSYSPDYDTEVFDLFGSRALWKIISSGYGICNGVSKVAQYMFSRVGIDSEIISSDSHSFLKIKDIELPLENGEVIRGTTILDSTWNLATNRFGGMPGNFFISYEQARKNDVDYEGKDHESHKNDEELQDATLNYDEQSLRNLFKSVGLTDKDGYFPVKDLVEKSIQIDRTYANEPEINIKNQLLLLKQTYPEFVKCQNSAMTILSDILLNNDNLKFNKCVVNRVYDRSDDKKKPVLYIYIDSNTIGKKFYFPNNDGDFLELNQEDFIKKFECYETDLNSHNRN